MTGTSRTITGKLSDLSQGTFTIDPCKQYAVTVSGDTFTMTEVEPDEYYHRTGGKLESVMQSALKELASHRITVKAEKALPPPAKGAKWKRDRAPYHKR